MVWVSKKQKCIGNLNLYDLTFNLIWKHCKYLQKNLLLFTVFGPNLFKLDPSHSCVWMNKQGNERNFVKSDSVRSKLLARPLLSYCICKLTLHYTDYGHPMKAQIKDIWKIAPMWQTKYASAVPKNLAVGVDFRPGSESDFLTGRP